MGEFAVYGVGSGDVGAIALVPDAQVHQQQAAILAGIPVGFIMEHAAVLSAAGNRGEGNALRPQVMHHVFIVRLGLVFLHAGLQSLHHMLKGLIGDVNGPLHQLNFLLILPHPQFGNHGPEIAKGYAGMVGGKLLGFGQIVVRQIGGLMAIAVKIADRSRRKIQQVVELRLKSIHKANILNLALLLCLIHGDHLTRPPLRRRVRLLDIKGRPAVFPGFSHQQNHILPAQARQVEEVPVGFKFMVGIRADVGRRTGIENQQGFLLHLVQDALSSRFVIHEYAPFRTISHIPEYGKSATFLRSLPISGAPCWTRTNDLRINSPSLYRLS